MKKKNTVTKLLKNKKMNSEVYKKRREVMSIIYEVKKMVSIPRVELRITENDRSTLGVGRMGDNVLWISERVITDSKYDIRTIVYHELLHCIYGVEHDDTCPLMKPIYTGKLSKSECQKHFMKHVR